MPFSEDLTQFFDSDEFAEVVTFTRDGDEVATASVIFNDPTHAVVAEQAEIEEPAPFVLASAVSLAAVKRSDTVTIRSIDFKVERIRPDGTGLVRLDLAAI